MSGGYCPGVSGPGPVAARRSCMGQDGPVCSRDGSHVPHKRLQSNRLKYIAGTCTCNTDGIVGVEKVFDILTGGCAPSQKKSSMA